ncbi:MAG TPA: YfbU family protein [Candidatus Saccharimonadales bacterium]|nr:YfbU family protein [Candidatus Saccharimonadales bacterium]
MGQLTITLPDDLEEEIREAVRYGKYGSVSDFARDAFKGELSGRPSYWERFLAVHVLENNKMLKQLTEDGNWGSDELLGALRWGYPNRYADAHGLVQYEGLSLEDTDFVQSVLEMYRALQHGYDSSGVVDEELAKDVLFEGFDGNGGDGYLGFTNFLVDNGYFATVRPLDKIPHLNSHSSVNDMYRRMLDEYKAIKAASKDRWHMKPMALDDVKRVLAAQVHPDNRPHKTSNNW